MAWFDEFNLPGATITGHFAFVREDGPDADDAPDLQLASGKVRFEPTAKAVRANGAWVGISPVTAQIFEGEIIVSEEDPRPLRLLSTDADTGVEGWGWEATFDIEGASIKPIRFLAPVTGVHLTGDNLIPITGQPVEVIEGADGVSVVGARDNGDQTVSFLLSDGTETDPVAIPPGPAGVGIASISDPDAESLVTITYTDGSTSTVRAIVGAPGDDGHTPVISWEGTALVIDGETGPDLRGAPGKDSTVPGPAPDVAWDGTRLVVGGETSPDLKGEPGTPGAPGSKGDPGDLGSTLIYGAGRPDITSSMTPETAANVAAASSGAEFISTDGSQGAWRWQKLGTTWTVTVGDTGWRDITATAAVQLGGTNPRLAIVRVGTQVTIVASGITGSNGGVHPAVSGFRAHPVMGNANTAVMVNNSDEVAGQLKISLGSRFPYWASSGSKIGYGAFSWPTSDAWPATLPGTPA